MAKITMNEEGDRLFGCPKKTVARDGPDMNSMISIQEFRRHIALGACLTDR